MYNFIFLYENVYSLIESLFYLRSIAFINEVQY